MRARICNHRPDRVHSKADKWPISPKLLKPKRGSSSWKDFEDRGRRNSGSVDRIDRYRESSRARESSRLDVQG